MNFVPTMVSVIVPTYNAEAYLAETLDSVLQQDWQPLEILVVDDGSTDNSIAIAESFGNQVRVIPCLHRGLAATRNSGIGAARGEFLLHLDADDLLTPHSISIRMQIMRSDPALDIVVGKLECFISPEIPPGERLRYQLPAELQLGHLPGASIVRASAFVKFGVINESFAVNADLDWSVKARDEGARIHEIDDVVLKRRIHGKNLSLVRKQELDSSRLRILRASLGRRRKASAGQLTENKA